MPRPSALVLGATGGIGGQVARTLLQRGWRVRALHRDPVAAAARRPGLAIEWVGGDAMEAADVSAAARGASVIVHAVNPPGYKDWHRFVVPMLDHTIAAARTHGARIVLPGNVYNHGPTRSRCWTSVHRSTPTPARAGCASRWSSASCVRRPPACARSSCAAATSSAPSPATAGSRRRS